MSDAIDTTATATGLEHVPSVAAPAVRHPNADSSLVGLAAPLADLVALFDQYQQALKALLNESDYQQIGGKSFRKKSGWRKLNVAFGVSTSLRERVYEREGRNIIRAEVVAVATAPGGRLAEGLGACDAFERCCEQPCRKRNWSNHSCCSAECNGIRHFSNPNHDIPATAATRATNRASSDLYGMGEVSAEEMVGDHAPPADAPPAEEHRVAQPEPTVTDWFVDNGWQSQAAHDQWRKDTTDALKVAEIEVQQTFAEARREMGYEWSRPATHAEARQLDRVLAKLIPPDPDPDPADVKPAPEEVGEAGRPFEESPPSSAAAVEEEAAGPSDSEAEQQPETIGDRIPPTTPPSPTRPSQPRIRLP